MSSLIQADASRSRLASLLLVASLAAGCASSVAVPRREQRQTMTSLSWITNELGSIHLTSFALTGARQAQRFLRTLPRAAGRDGS
jgi:hypothetical protein